MNPPVDNNDNTPPIIGIGGFTFARSSTPTSNPTVTLQATGTFICVVMRFGDGDVRDCFVQRYAGGSVVEGIVGATGGTLQVMIFRIA